MPGAREISADCCETVVDNLVNDTTYWFGISATNCAGASATSELISATPAVIPESVSIEPAADSMTVGFSRRYEAQVLDSLGNPSVGTVVVWASSDESLATVQPATSETNAEGVAEATVRGLSAGSVEIVAEVWDTGVRSSLSLSISEPLRGAAAVAAGDDHSCAAMSNGEVLCWGSNEWGQLGDGTLTRSFTPVSVDGLNGAVDVVAGAQHTCALTDVGGVKCWGLTIADSWVLVTLPDFTALSRSTSSA